MLLKVPATLAALGAPVVFATDVPSLLRQAFPPPASLEGRQVGGQISNWIPAVCQSQCAVTVQYIQYCLTAKDVPACTSICTQSGINSFVQCLQCGINNNPTYAANNLQGLNGDLSQAASGCNAAGSSVSVATLVAASTPVSGSTSATGSVSGSMTGSVTPAASQTITGYITVPTSAIGTATSKSAASAIRPLNFSHAAGAAIVGLLGVAGGAVLAL